MISEVPVDVLKALVPVEDHVALAHAPYPLHAEVNHILEVSIEEKDKDKKVNLVKENEARKKAFEVRLVKCNDNEYGTYFLPVGTLRGLTSARLKWANTNSHGAAS
jgi:hypothetical protein